MKTKQVIKFIFWLLLPLIGFIVADLLIKYHPESICLWKNLTGKDCWGCGLTRAMHSLMLLDFKTAYEFNSKVYIVAPVLFYVWIKEVYKTFKSLK